MSVRPIFADLGTVLSLDSGSLQNGVFTFGNPIALSSTEIALKGLVSFHNGGSSKITVTVVADLPPAQALGFSPINIVVPGFGPPATTVQFDPANGLSQSFWIFSDNQWGTGQVKVGAESNGAVAGGDAIIVIGRGSAS